MKKILSPILLPMVGLHYCSSNVCMPGALAFQSAARFPQERYHNSHGAISASAKRGDGESDGAGQEALNSMRKILEQSWNAETMGEIPADADAAAKEAFVSFQRALADGHNVCFVDLLLPSYDINQGSELYDEVQITEYCIRLSEYMDGKTSILVKDDKVRQTVSRVLEAREKAAEEKLAKERNRAEEEATRDRERLAVDVAKKEAEDKRKSARMEEERKREDENESTEDNEEDGTSKDSSEVDDFRQSLMASWEDDPEESDDAGSPSSAEEDGVSPSAQSSDRMVVDDSISGTDTAPRITMMDSNDPAAAASEAGSSTQVPYVKRYRIASLFGDREIKSGTEMMSEVVEAIRENALPEEDEKNMIILSSLSLQETVACRSLVNKYEDAKNIILVNCQLAPLPPELRRAQTVYSILPLIGKPKGPTSEDDKPPPRVLVLRRYPKPWEVYVDVGTGFELADSIPPTIQTKRGLTMEIITESVRKFLG